MATLPAYQLKHAPKLVMVNFRVNSGFAAKLLSSGIPQKAVTFNQMIEKINRHAQEATDDNFAYRFNRTDTAGFTQSDSGVLMFDPQIDFGTLPDLRADLQALGYNLYHVNIHEKPTDHSQFARFWFAPDMGQHELKGEQEQLFNQLFNGVYGRIFCFANPDATVTINLTSRSQDRPALSSLRAEGDWSFFLEQAKTTAPAVASR